MSERAWIALCAVDAIADPGARGFELEGRRIFAVRKAGEVRVYLNVCPHRFSPLELEPDQFLDLEREYILCSTHGALFRITDGICVSGPCKGAALTPEPFVVREGQIMVKGGA